MKENIIMGLFENDITMCTTKYCPVKEKCYRYTAIPDRIQSYSDFSPVCCEDGSFNFFIDNKEEKNE